MDTSPTSLVSTGRRRQVATRQKGIEFGDVELKEITPPLEKTPAVPAAAFNIESKRERSVSQAKTATAVAEQLGFEVLTSSSSSSDESSSDEDVQDEDKAISHRIDEIIRQRQNFIPSVFEAVRFWGSTLLYMIYIGLLSYFVWDERKGAQSFNFVSAVQRDLTGNTMFPLISSLNDTFSYIYNVTCPAYVMGFAKWNGQPLNSYQALNGVNKLNTSYLQQSRFLSGMRLRQQRIKGEDNHDWRVRFGPTLNSATTERWDTTTFYKGNKTWEYRDADETCKIKRDKGDVKPSLCKNTVHGSIADYLAGGFIHDISIKDVFLALQKFPVITPNIARDLCFEFYKFIRDDEWLDEKTRVLFFEFSLMNTNLGNPMFCMPTVMFEFPAEGGVEASFQALPFLAQSETITLREVVLLGFVVITSVYIIGMVGYSIYTRNECLACLLRDPKIAEALKDHKWYQCDHCFKKFARCDYNLDCIKELNTLDTEIIELLNDESSGHDIAENCHHDIVSKEKLRSELEEQFIRCPRCGTTVVLIEHHCFRYYYINDLSNILYLLSASTLIYAFIEKLIVRRAFGFRMEAYREWLMSDTMDYPFFDFGPLQQRMTNTYSLWAVSVVVAYLTFYSYLQHFASVSRFLNLFRSGATGILSFMFAFGIAFVGFAIAFHITLGPRMKQYRDLFDAMFNSFRLLLVDISYDQFNGDPEVLMTLLYVSYGISCTIVGMNVFLAIVDSSYKIGARKQPLSRARKSLRLLFEHVTDQTTRRIGKAWKKYRYKSYE
eukprot:PhF_6_TR14121/c0_g1_i2/m.22569